MGRALNAGNLVCIIFFLIYHKFVYQNTDWSEVISLATIYLKKSYKYNNRILFMRKIDLHFKYLESILEKYNNI